MKYVMYLWLNPNTMMAQGGITVDGHQYTHSMDRYDFENGRRDMGIANSMGSDYTNYIIPCKPIRVGGVFINCYPSDPMPTTTKSVMYMAITQNIPSWHTWSLSPDHRGFIIQRNDKMVGPELLHADNGDILDAYTRIEHELVTVNRSHYTSEGRWHPEYEYLMREGKYEA